MKLYNTLTRRVEEFKPMKGPAVKLYSCGPTVYDYPQLGNLRSFVFVDTLRRALKLAGYEVQHVMNITDVGHLVSDEDEGEDKLEKGAQREGLTVWEVAERYIKVFLSDIKRLNILQPNGYVHGGSHYARATDFIPQQIEIVKLLMEKGYAYRTDSAIYFDVLKLPSYGELTGQKLSDKEVAARPEVVSDENKHHPQDFALWFFRTGRFAEHEMHWPSPWGEGFPGWHLECSAIIHSTLGDPIDIHTGGVDHIGTHHTNEMAQTEAVYGHKLANFWVHNEFLLVDGQRMGKSLNNFYTMADIEKHGFSPLALRLLFLQAHYRSQLNFTWKSLEAAAANLSSLFAWADMAHQPKSLALVTDKQHLELMDKVKSALNDDLNTAQALAALNESTAIYRPNKKLLEDLDAVLGLSLSNRPDITEAEKDIIERREAARKEQSWAEADKLRQELAAKGVEINDSPAGPVWSRL